MLITAKSCINGAPNKAAAELTALTELRARDLVLAYLSVDLRDDTGAALTVYAAEPGSPSELALHLLASWAAAPITPERPAGATATTGPDRSDTPERP